MLTAYMMFPKITRIMMIACVLSPCQACLLTSNAIGHRLIPPHPPQRRLLTQAIHPRPLALFRSIRNRAQVIIRSCAPFLPHASIGQRLWRTHEILKNIMQHITPTYVSMMDVVLCSPMRGC